MSGRSKEPATAFRSSGKTRESASLPTSSSTKDPIQQRRLGSRFEKGGKTPSEPKKKDYPLHKLAFEGEFEKLKAEIQKKSKLRDFDINYLDGNGNTILHLAIHNKHTAIVKYLLAHPRINPLLDNSLGWSPLQEARASGNKDAVELVYKANQLMVRAEFETRLPMIAAALKSLPDFTMVIKWGLSTWVPLVSRYCPSDTYTIYKKGASLRLDSTLVGFENYEWLRGSVTVIFRGESKGNNFVFLHHDEQRAEYVMSELPEEDTKVLARDIDELMQQPLIHLESNLKLVFTPQNIWSGSQKTAQVAGFDCNLFNLEGLSFSLEQRTGNGTAVCSTTSYDEYQKAAGKLLYEKENISKSSKTFSCTAHLSKDFPLSTSDLLPIFEALAPTNESFARIKQILACDFPEDQFPLKIEIPAFPTVTASVLVESFQEGTVGPDKFEIPADYKKCVS